MPLKYDYLFRKHNIRRYFIKFFSVVPNSTTNFFTCFIKSYNYKEKVNQFPQEMFIYTYLKNKSYFFF